LTCIAVALVTWFVQSKIENDGIRDEKRAENQQVLDEIKASVVALEKSFSASSSWESSLSNGKKYRFRPIFSIELEKVWINNSPILFLGSLIDVATLDETHYQVSFEQSLWGTMFGSELKLSLKAEKKIIDKFMSENPKLIEDYGFNNGVAVAAQIFEIESSQISDAEGVVTEVKTGNGELLGIVFTGDAEL
tara:strand:- start:170 stop:745 length:576 start_codon:yes stop_codon:yes gene_type:complete